jgi:hypothetical protein
MRGHKLRPLCCDCGIDTLAIDEFYMISNDVWDQAWAGRPRYPKMYGGLNAAEILCIGCLEKRIGRTLCRTDFTDAPINDPDRLPLSDRFLDRLAADVSHLLVAPRPT